MIKSIFILLLTFSFVCRSQETWDKIEIITISITDHVKMLEGQGGNIGVVIGDHEILVIDAQFEPLYDKIRGTISEISKLPIEYLLNTHWHGDHTGGNNRFNQDGAVLVAHENVKVRMSNPQTIAYFGAEVPASSNESRPEITFESTINIELGNETVRFIHVQNAHTDGDGIVYLPKNNIIHMGDIYFAGMYPFIDISSGGNVLGMIKACNKALEMSDDQTKIIPGHGSLSNKAELVIYTEMLNDLLIKVTQAKSDGKSFKVIVESGLTNQYEEKFGNGFIAAKDILSFIYQSIE